MSDDDRLVPGGYPIPVSVRRPLGGGGDPALMPSQASQTASPPVPLAPQIIYINNAPPAPTAGVPAATAPPIHHHHYATQHTTHRVSLRVRSPASHSALGTASLALGIIACVVCWVPWLGLVAVPVGAIGAFIGLLGVLISLLFHRSSASLPLAGIFICCLAAGISIASTKSLPYWRKQLDQAMSAVTPFFLPPHAAALSPFNSPPPAMPPAAPHSNLFDPGDSAMPSPASAAPSPPSPAPVPAHAGVVPHLNASIAAARDQLDAAERACDERTMQNVDYQSALKIAADARARELALRESAPGSSDLMQASQAMIKADNAASDLLTRAQASDPQVIAARQALASARSAAQ